MIRHNTELMTSRTTNNNMNKQVNKESKAQLSNTITPSKKKRKIEDLYENVAMGFCQSKSSVESTDIPKYILNTYPKKSQSLDDESCSDNKNEKSVMKNEDVDEKSETLQEYIKNRSPVITVNGMTVAVDSDINSMYMHTEEFVDPLTGQVIKKPEVTYRYEPEYCMGCDQSVDWCHDLVHGTYCVRAVYSRYNKKKTAQQSMISCHGFIRHIMKVDESIILDDLGSFAK